MGASDHAGLTRVRLLKSDAFRKPGSRLWASRSFAAYGQPFNEGLIEVDSARVNPFRYGIMKLDGRAGNKIGTGPHTKKGPPDGRPLSCPSKV